MSSIKKRGRPAILKDAFAELEERFDQHKLNHIIENFDDLRKGMRPKYFEDGKDPLTQLRRYLAKSKDGRIPVKYKQNKSFGRFYAVGGLSLQTLPREVRHTIASEFYVDIDIKNAHPVILAHMCAERGIPCKLLRKYNTNRDEFLASISESKEQSKVVILSIVNGGTKAMKELANPPAFLRDFKDEVDAIHATFAKDSAFKAHKERRVAEGIDYNHEASYMNTLLCDFENKALQVIWECLNKPTNCVWCFDGIMIRNDSGDQDIDKIENAIIKALHIELQLAIKPMTEGFELGPVKPYVPKEPNRFYQTDPMCYNDFRNAHLGQEFDDMEAAHAGLADFYRVIWPISYGEGFFVKKMGGGEVDCAKKLGQSDFTISIASKQVSFQKYINGLPSLKKVQCSLGKCPSDVFNMWGGFQAQRVGTKSDNLELMKSFIMESWASGNVEHYNYIISWFAGLVSNLEGINMSALAMISKQGAGKSTLFDFMKLILGERNCLATNGVDSITGRFNKSLECKRLVNVNEMSSTREEFKANFDKIKTYITDSTFEVEPKGRDKYTIENICNFVFFTNHRDSLIIEESDRRFAIFEMSDAHLNDKQYFIDLRAKCFTQDVANEFYTYLLDFPADLTKIPETSIKDEMKLLSLSTPLKYIRALEEEKELMSEVSAGASCVSAASLYAHYSKWCVENGERALSGTKFGTIASQKLNKRKSNGKMVYDLYDPKKMDSPPTPLSQ